jgi:hypothetical protein
MVRLGAKDHQKTATVVKESTYETAQYLCLSYLYPSCKQISFKSFIIFFVVSLLQEKYLRAFIIYLLTKNWVYPHPFPS